ncbi:hypothetical protein D3C76_1144410 [compost metagenome]
MNGGKLPNSLIQTLNQLTFFNYRHGSWIHISLQGDTTFYYFLCLKIHTFNFFIGNTKKIRNFTNRRLLNIYDPPFKNIIYRSSGQPTGVT